MEFWTTDITTDIDIYLYDDFDGTTLSNLIDSKLDNSFSEAGYHSVELDTPVPVSVGDDVLLADGAVVGITGNEVITFNAAGSINVTGATVDVDGAFTASTIASDGAVSGTTITGTGKLSTTVTTEQLRLNYDAFSNNAYK